MVRRVQPYRLLGLALASVSPLLFPAAASAQSVESFYKGKTINVIVPYGPGGYYDIGARLLSRHYGRHIPGSPNIVVQNQPSAGGIGLANQFSVGSNGDGTTLGVLQRAVPQYALVGYQNTKFDPLKLSWIGSLSSYKDDSYVLVLRAEHPAANIADLQNPALKTRLGAGRSGSANLLYALVAKDLLKLNVDMVRGYDGTAPIFLALERGEVDGLFADFSTIKTSMADRWKSGAMKAVVQFGRKTRAPDLPDAPTAVELVADPNDLAFLEFAELPFYIAMPIAGPVGIPKDRLKALSDALIATSKDPALIEEANRMRFEVSAIDGASVKTAIERASEMPEEAKKRFKALITAAD